MKRPGALLSLTVESVVAFFWLGLLAFAVANVAASEGYLPGVKWFFDTVRATR